MAHPPLALSVHHFITSVGADAGFASIVGLAILVLLFFAQARETTTLRDELADAEARMAQLESRLSAAVRNAGTAGTTGTPAQAMSSAPAQPAGASAPAPSHAPSGAPLQPMSAAGGAGAGSAVAPASAGAGSAPPGVGAPAQGAATRLIPDLTTVQRPATAAAASGSVASRPASSGNGAGGTTGVPITPPPAPAPSPARPPAAPAAARRPAPSRAASPPPANSSRSRRILSGVIALIVVAAIVVALVIITSAGGGTSNPAGTSSSTSTSTAPAHHRSRPTSSTTALVPANVTVAVLNGTATNGLARRVSAKLTGAGYRAGAVTTAADQTHTTTAITYQPGQKAAAEAVAKALGLPGSTVAPMDATTRTVACQGLSATSCAGQGVVVTVGANLAGVQ